LDRGQQGESNKKVITGRNMYHYIRARIITLQKSERGASAVEYGLLVGLIAVAIIFTVLALGGELNRLFGTVNDELSQVG
jgi:pilus assembly protein Flp/PilA